MRQPRADALRNRERLLSVTRDAFIAGEDAIAFDEIARRAGVGIGTLYRHFATRKDLLEALYRGEVAALQDLAVTLGERHAPMEALRLWLIAFVDVLIAKRVIGPALSAIIGAREQLPASRDTLMATVRWLVSIAVEHGDFDASVDAVDLLRALSGTVGLAGDDRAAERARRIVDVLLTGATRRDAVSSRLERR